jgi:hypothetical protein
MTHGPDEQFEAEHLEDPNEFLRAEVGDGTPLQCGDRLPRKAGCIPEFGLGQALFLARAGNLGAKLS